MNSHGEIQKTKDGQHPVRKLADLIRESQELRRESREIRQRNIHLLAGMQRRWLRPVRRGTQSGGRKLAA